jgi:GT2 family glycosyltransferase
MRVEQPRYDVAVIVVGLNAREYVRGCFTSLLQANWRGRTYEIIYVDNGSSDGSVEMVRNHFPVPKILVNDRNLGFCRAANQGAALAESRYYFFLNDDTLVLDDAIPLLIEAFEEMPSAGIIGSRLLNLDRTDQWSGRRFPSAWNALLGRRSVLSRFFPNAKPVANYLCKAQLKQGEPFDVDWLSAAAMMIKRESFERLGGFFENYYYFHELLICKRATDYGERVVLHPDSRIVHYEGMGSGTRPYSVKKRHLINFHLGAYRWYCEHYKLNKLHPRRWLCAAMMSIRAGGLIAAARLHDVFWRAGGSPVARQSGS